VDDGVVAHRIGAGGVAATPVRAVQTEAALRRPALDAGHRAAGHGATCAPSSSRSPTCAPRPPTAAEVLGNLLQRFWLESQGLQQINLASFLLEEA
jgi:xanthine dehydrogenase small subunit